MDRRRLRKIKEELDAISRSPFGRKSRDLERIAKALGRERFNRGSEPNYVRTEEPRFTYPLSIPHHSSDLKVGTTKSIVRSLYDDVATWEQWLEENQADDIQSNEDDVI